LGSWKVDLSLEARHITQAITELGEKRSVITTRAIFNQRGVKVVEKGVTVNACLYDRLMAHVLDLPLEDCVSSLPAVTGQSLRASAEAAIEEVALFRRICVDATTRRQLLDAVASIPLPQPIAFQLTLASEVRPELFQHLVRTAVFAAWMSQESALSRFDLTVAASAGLLHDIGMLHLDPILLTPQGAISEEQRQQLYIHPKVSSTLIERHHAYPKEVLRAVMEHHEFLDGSGYPQNLSRKSISPLGCILSLAELFTAMHSPASNAPERRLWVLLRMNQHRYTPLLVERVLKTLEPARCAFHEPIFRLPDPVACLRDICLGLSSWPAELQNSPALSRESQEGMGALNQQAAQLQRTLANVGVSSEQLDQLGHDALDEALLWELTLFACEAAWQLRSLTRQTKRRWRQLVGSEHPEPLKNWLEQADVILANEKFWAPEHDSQILQPAAIQQVGAAAGLGLASASTMALPHGHGLNDQGSCPMDIVDARILLVEDDEAMRVYVSGALARLGIQAVKVCADGSSALQLMGSFWPDVVLTDIHMEPMGGLQLVRQLREHFSVEFRQTRVIFMSADASPQTIKQALPLGNYGYIVKPPTLEILRAKIQHALKA
jgi:response regulator RpfG family c-di-GMP phosphodiesterase